MKILKMLSGLGIRQMWPIILVLGLILGVVYLGYDYHARGVKIENLSVKLVKARFSLDSTQSEFSKMHLRYKKSLDSAAEEIKLMSYQIGELQKVCLEERNQKLYWKDFAEKLESGDFCIERKGVLRKKVLVPCKK